MQVIVSRVHNFHLFFGKGSYMMSCGNNVSETFSFSFYKEGSQNEILDNTLKLWSSLVLYLVRFAYLEKIDLSKKCQYWNNLTFVFFT